MWNSLESLSARLYSSFASYTKSVISLAINKTLDWLGGYTMTFVILSLPTGAR